MPSSAAQVLQSLSLESLEVLAESSNMWVDEQVITEVEASECDDDGVLDEDLSDDDEEGDVELV